MKLQVLDLQGQSVGDVELDDMVFGIVPRKDCMSAVVRWQLAKRQAGTHACKGRSDVSRTSKKLYRQKGTGNARHGARTANIFRGGGVIFGPTPLSHAFKLNKKFRELALRSLLSLKYNEKNLIILNSLEMSEGKTSALKKNLATLGINSGLFIDVAGNSAQHENFKRAASNLHKIDLLLDCGLNVYDGLQHEKMVMTMSALESVQKRLLLD
jgi:large subunit ribosomal protein L4